MRDDPGRLRLKNRVLYRKKELCDAIERELMSVLGIDNYKTNSIRSTVQVDYDPRQLSKAQVVEILDSALAEAEHPTTLDRLDLHLPLCTLSLPFAAAAQFAVPPLLPAAAVLFAYTSIPTFREARKVLFLEKRLGVDVLDAIVVAGCLGTMTIFPGAVLCWCLSFGRVLVKRTQDNSKKLLLNAFGKQPRYVWLYREGVEVQISLDRLQKGDIIVVNTGEVMPVDGHVVEGMAMLDQHALTGESTPSEKGVGDRVFASTVMVAGKVYVSVETSGTETASAKISQILNDTAGYKLASQHKGEILADKAVIPTLTIGTIGLFTMGPAGAVAVLNSDFGTGIRMAAPLAMLSSLALCAHKGILVKDGRALELMNEVDTVAFRQDRYTDPRTPPKSAGSSRVTSSRPSASCSTQRPPNGSSTTRSRWRSCTRPASSSSNCPRPMILSTRSATASPSRSKGTPYASGASGSWRWKESTCRRRWSRPWTKRTAKVIRW